MMNSSENPKIKTYLQNLEYNKNPQIVEKELKRLRENFQWVKKIQNQRILLYGDVQSGKTNNIIYALYNLLPNHFDICVYLAGTKNLLLNQNFSRVDYALKYLEKIVVGNANTKINKSRIANILHNDEKIVMTSLKNPLTVNNIAKSFLEFKQNLRILIINDEGDEASLDTKSNTLKMTNAINKLLLTNSQNLYMSITATPFKNFLYDDKLNFSNSFTLKSSSEYTSIKHFEDNYLVYSKWKVAVIDSLIYWVNICLTTERETSQILFNIFTKVKGHKEIQKYIQEAIEVFKTIDEVSTAKLEKRILEVEKRMNLKDLEAERYFAFFSEDNIDVIVSNSLNKDSYEKIQKSNKHQIIIGGFNLSRGITFDRLLVEVLLKESAKKQSASVLLQRARWLGYRKDFAKMKIFVTEKLKKSFFEITDLIDFTKKAIKEDYISKKEFKDKIASYEFIEE